MVSFDGGNYMLGEVSVPAGQTIVYDVRSLRDSQKPDVNGNVLPVNAVQGKVHWSIRGSEIKSLIGRIEQVDITNGLSMTVACECVCPWDWGDEARILPGSVTSFPGDAGSFQIQSRYRDCYGVDKGFWTLSDYALNNLVTYSSDDPGVATFTAPGTGTAIAPGSTYLRAQWTEYYYDLNEEAVCIAIAAAAACAAFCDVQCAVPVNFRQTTGTLLPGGALGFEYSFDSSSGDLTDLRGCRIGERVEYPGGNPFSYPSPPYATNSTTNPFEGLNDVDADFGFISDINSPPGGTGFARPYTESNITATQYFQYKCPCKNGGQYVRIAGPIPIVRQVTIQGLPDWTYIIEKSSLRNFIRPLP